MILFQWLICTLRTDAQMATGGLSTWFWPQVKGKKTEHVSTTIVNQSSVVLNITIAESIKSNRILADGCHFS